jgi:hypothetical protein
MGGGGLGKGKFKPVKDERRVPPQICGPAAKEDHRLSRARVRIQAAALECAFGAGGLDVLLGGVRDPVRPGGPARRSRGGDRGNDRGRYQGRGKSKGLSLELELIPVGLMLRLRVLTCRNALRLARASACTRRSFCSQR